MSPEDYEKKCAPDGFFKMFGIEHEVIWDVREHEGEEIEEAAPVEKVKAKPGPKAKTEVQG